MKYTWNGMILIICGMFLLSCGEQKEDPSKSLYAVYYLDSEMTELVKETHELSREPEDIKGLVKDILKTMREGRDATVRSALGDDVEITDVQYKEAQVSLYFSATYNSRNGTEEILSRAAIVQTLCGIPGVEYVDFYVEDQPLMIAGNAVGLMNRQSFLLSTDKQEEEQTKNIVIYFSNESGNALRAVHTSVNYGSAAPLAKLLVESLIQGEETISQLKKKGEVIPTIPSGTVLNNLTIRDKICYLDFSKDINSLLQGIRSDVVVYSIVNTLCELSDVNRVQITVDGEQQEKYGEMEGFHLVLERKLDLVEKE